jgi:hypothetical protein
LIKARQGINVARGDGFTESDDHMITGSSIAGLKGLKNALRVSYGDESGLFGRSPFGLLSTT